MELINDTPLSFDDINLTPEAFIELMFQRTDLDNVLYIPGWHYDWAGWQYDVPGSTDDSFSYRCRLEWTILDMERITGRFRSLYAALEKIAPNLDCPEAITDPELQKVWQTYLKPLDGGTMSPAALRDIEDRLGTQLWIQNIAADFSKGQPLDDFEKSALIEYMEVSVSPAEKTRYEQYKKNLHRDAEARVGGKICAYDLIFRSTRLCRLMNLGAPACIIQNEARILAAAMVLNAFGTSRESVDNSARLWWEQLELMDDEAMDALTAPKKANSMKSLLPVFVVKILKEKSNKTVHLRQVDILRELEYYEIFVERKALNRTIHTLADSSLPIRQDNTGVWYEQ